MYLRTSESHGSSTSSSGFTAPPKASTPEKLCSGGAGSSLKGSQSSSCASPPTTRIRAFRDRIRGHFAREGDATELWLLLAVVRLCP